MLMIQRPNVAAVVVWGLSAAGPVVAQIEFVEVSAAAGVSYEHGYEAGWEGDPLRLTSCGVAAGDYDRDGLVDLFVVRGDFGATMLFRNLGDGTFDNVAAAAGVELPGGLETGPLFGDYDGDGWLDLFLGGVWDSPLRLFRNQGDGTFAEVTATSGLATARENTFSAALGDPDRDGDLDLALAHWSEHESCATESCDGHLWRNNGDGTFSEIDAEAGLVYDSGRDFTYTPLFADINNDRWPDLLMASDFVTTRVFLNDGDGTFSDVTDRQVITDDNGMGQSVADHDHDGDLDWYVTSIYNPDTGKTGNRFYRNLGDGTFEDATDETGTRVGFWGWASCFADFDNDGHPDLVHVNGWSSKQNDPAPLFMSNGDGTFTESGQQVGFIETPQGRGLVCFDYDRDGDLDLFIANAFGFSSLWRNDGGNANPWLNLTLKAPGRNPFQVGARVYLEAGGVTQMRELQMGSNFESNDPVEAHFGLGTVETAEEVRIEWTDLAVSTYHQVAARRWLEAEELLGDAFEDGVLPAGWTFERGEWSEAAGNLHGIPDADVGSEIVARAVAAPFAGCDLCQVEATLAASDTFGQPARIQATLLGWYVDRGNNVAVSLKPAQDRVVFTRTVSGAVALQRTRSLPLVEGQAYETKVAVDGRDFAVHVDGEELMRVRNSAGGVPFGTVGIESRNATLDAGSLAVSRLTER